MQPVLCQLSISEKELNSSTLATALENVSMQKVQMVQKATNLMTEINLKAEKLNSNEKNIIKKAGDAMKNVLNYFSDLKTSDRISRTISEEQETHEELQADCAYLLKDKLGDVEDEMSSTNQAMSVEKER